MTSPAGAVPSSAFHLSDIPSSSSTPSPSTNAFPTPTPTATCLSGLSTDGSDPLSETSCFDQSDSVAHVGLSLQKTASSPATHQDSGNSGAKVALPSPRCG